MRLKNLDLIMAVLLAVLDLCWALVPDRSPVIGVILVLPLVFVLPGYTFTEILFYKRLEDNNPERLFRTPRLIIEQPFNTSDRIILSLGLSLAIDVLGALVLNLSPIGLRALSWAAFLGLLTSIFAFVAAYLRRRAAISTYKAASQHFRITVYDGILLVLALMVICLSVVYATTSAEQQPSPGFTQFWILPSHQKDNSCTVLIGVHSFEATSTKYHVVMNINGSQTATWSSIVLAPQGEWDKIMALKPKAPGDIYIEALLYRADSPDVAYRNVHLTLHQLKGSKEGGIPHCVI